MNFPLRLLAAVLVIASGEPSPQASAQSDAVSPPPKAPVSADEVAKKTAEPTSDFTGEDIAGTVRALTPGPLLPEATAEPPPTPVLPVVTRVLYVSPTSTDKKATGLTPDSPLTPQRAAYLSQPGDVILFAAGDYQAEPGKTLLTLERSGEPGKPIIYAPAPGARVVFHVNDGWEAVKVAGASHLEIRGFRMIGSANSVTMEEATREMSNLQNPRTCGNGIGIDWKKPDKVSPHYITVRDCVVSDFGGAGIFASHADHITFEGNTVFRCAFWSPYACSGMSIYQPIACDDSTDYKIIIRNNVSFGNYENVPFYHSNRNDPSKRKFTDGNGIILDDFMNSQSWNNANGKPYAGRTLVANNVVFANGGSGIHAFKSNNVDVIHNYAADNNRHPFLKDGQIFGNASRNMRILNNVMVAPAGKPVNSNNKNEGLVQDHNVYASLDGGVPKFAGDLAHNVLTAPGLELIGWLRGKRTFQAAADSPLRGAGVRLPEAGGDFFGKARDTVSDIGPFVLPQFHGALQRSGLHRLSLVCHPERASASRRTSQAWYWRPFGFWSGVQRGPGVYLVRGSFGSLRSPQDDRRFLGRGFFIGDLL